jgi:predicted metal-binding membrane protein
MVSGRASQQAFFGVSAPLFAASAAVTIVWCASMSAMGEMWIPGQMRPGAAASLLLGMWVVMMMVAMMLLPSLVPMLWRYSARPCDRTGKNPEVLIGFFAKTF